MVSYVDDCLACLFRVLFRWHDNCSQLIAVLSGHYCFARVSECLAALNIGMGVRVNGILSSHSGFGVSEWAEHVNACEF